MSGGDRVVIFTATTGYRHESIPHGVAVLAGLLAESGLATEHTEDPAALHAGRLEGCAGVVWLSTSGEVLDAEGRRSLAGFVSSGGGFAAIHSATASEYGWEDFERLVGARFEDHPEIQPGVVAVEDAGHPSTAVLPARWEWEDEWYNFRANPRGRVRVLAVADEATYHGGTMGADHPLVWCATYGEGRTWYTSLGHRPEAFDDPRFRAHLAGGVRSVVRGLDVPACPGDRAG